MYTYIESFNDNNYHRLDNAAKRLDQAITGITTYFSEFHEYVGKKDYAKNAERLAGIGKGLFRDAYQYLDAAKDIIAKSDTPQAQRVAQDIAEVNRRIAKAISESGYNNYVAAAQKTYEATEAFRKSKVAGGAGLVVSAVDVANKASKGDWNGVGQAVAGMVGGAIGAKLATLI